MLPSTRVSCAALLSAAVLTACGSTVQQSSSVALNSGLGDGTTPTGTSTTQQLTTAGGGSTTGSRSPAGTTASTSSGGSTGTQAGTTGSTPTSQGGSSGGSVTLPAVTGGTLPPTGRGWTKTTISIGYTTSNDFNSAVAAAGYNSINAGDQVGDIEAVLSAINASGGLFGRRVVGVDKDDSTASVSANPTAVSAADCAYFTQDKPVIAVLNLQSALDTPTFRACMAKAKLPVMSLSIQPITQSILAALHGYLIPLLTPTYDKLAPVLISHLKSQSYFTGWNSTNGGASPATPVKTGLLVTNDNQGKEVGALLSKALGSVGQKPVIISYASSGSQEQSDFSSAVLKFRSEGVTHVMSDGAGIAIFMIQAQSQGFHPRYGISSYSAPQPFLEGLAPDGQLPGAVGVGVAPSLDVDLSQDPGPTPGSPYCAKVLKQGGQTFPQDKRFAQAVAFALCDGLRAVVSSAKSSGGLGGANLLQGFASIGPGFPTSFAFKSGLTSSNYALPGAGKDLAYSTGCSCFRYAGPTFAF